MSGRPKNPWSGVMRGLAATWLVVLAAIAMTIWVDPNAINPAIGIGVVAFVASCVVVPAWLEERRR